jgi:hypothetical protein
MTVCHSRTARVAPVREAARAAAARVAAARVAAVEVGGATAAFARVGYPARTEFYENPRGHSQP